MMRFALGVLVGYAWATGQLTQLTQLVTPERVDTLFGIVRALVVAAASHG